jgi:hypothetical protein
MPLSKFFSQSILPISSAWADRTSGVRKRAARGSDRKAVTRGLWFILYLRGYLYAVTLNVAINRPTAQGIRNIWYRAGELKPS